MTILIIVMVIFGTLLIFGIRKSYKLKKDNERLTNLNTSTLNKKETYKDFTEGHMYDNK
ncbi:hypothetical protein [Flavivirga aquatica]|uniref:hypothetical protein n=1 Tax=Flavivirga aquatica TaxID=1849968 RepID=UPI001F0A9007|nr:hypothetical protein [Flavivirga aquatica]